MRQAQMLTLLQSGFKTVEVCYNTSSDSMNLRNNRFYTFKTNLNLKVEDLVIVEGSGCFKTVRVVVVHDEPQIDLDADFDYKWVVSKLDLTAYNEIVEGEKAALKLLTNMERDKVRKAAQEQLVELYGDKVPMLDYSKGEKL